MLSACELIAFGVTRDPARAKEFYAGVLGLALVADEAFALVFDAHGTMVRIQKAQAFAPAPFTLLGWRVKGIEAYARKLSAAGVTPTRYPGFEQDELGIWSAPDGTRIVWFKDPDGNTLSLSEF